MTKKKKNEVDVIMLMTTMTGTVMQMLVNKDYYREFNNCKKMQDTAFDEILKTNMKTHIKHVFKATLGYE